jgi:hypothetical protein
MAHVQTVAVRLHTGHRCLSVATCVKFVVTLARDVEVITSALCFGQACEMFPFVLFLRRKVKCVGHVL